MTNEQQRKMLECAAKAFGIEHKGYCDTPAGLIMFEDADALKLWNPLTNPADTAEMCADLKISVVYLYDSHPFLSCFSPGGNNTEVAFFKDHDNSRMNAWMHAATMCAAKIGGYENDV